MTKQISYDCPDIDLPEAPELPIYSLTPSSTPDLVMKSYVASVAMMKHWQEAVIKQINSVND